MNTNTVEPLPLLPPSLELPRCGGGLDGGGDDGAGEDGGGVYVRVEPPLLLGRLSDPLAGAGVALRSPLL